MPTTTPAMSSNSSTKPSKTLSYDELPPVTYTEHALLIPMREAHDGETVNGQQALFMPMLHQMLCEGTQGKTKFGVSAAINGAALFFSRSDNGGKSRWFVITIEDLAKALLEETNK